MCTDVLLQATFVKFCGQKTVIPVLGPFAAGLFAVGHFAVGHFAVRILRRKDISSWDIAPYDFSDVGHFVVFLAVQSFRRKYFLRTFGSFSHF